MNVDFEQYDDGLPMKRTPGKTRDLGPLHNMLARGLPDWCDGAGNIMSRSLASHLGISYQALYKIYHRNRMPANHIKTLIALSAKTRSPSHKCLAYEDFAAFLG